MRGKVHISDAKTMMVTFDKDSKVDNTAYLYFSKLEDGGENIQKFNGVVCSSLFFPLSCLFILIFNRLFRVAHSRLRQVRSRLKVLRSIISSNQD